MSFPDIQPLFCVNTLRVIERTAQAGLPPRTLMQRAGWNAAQFIMQHLPSHPAHILILAGPGNNGGDGLEAAVHLVQAGHRIHIAFAGSVTSLPTDAKGAFEVWQAASSGVITATFSEEWPSDTVFSGTWDVIVDALFGIGLTRPITGKAADWIDRANHYPALRIALDIPSGLSADTGAVIEYARKSPNIAEIVGIAFRADRMLTFIGDKPGLHTYEGVDYSGQVTVDTLGIDALKNFCAPLKVIQNDQREQQPKRPLNKPDGYLNTPALFYKALPHRRQNSHKGQMGNLLVVGGNKGMVGAVLLAGRAGLHAGAGRVFLVAVNQTLEVDVLQPELMFRHVDEIEALGASAMVVGPGLGVNGQTQALMAALLNRREALLIDADGLNLIASAADLRTQVRAYPNDVILTPHPLEAARLLNISTHDIQANRIQAALQLATEYTAIVVLKGAGSIIAHPDGRWIVNPTGCPALSSAGTGDVLSGLIGGLVAQKMPAWEATLAAVWIHGRAAESLATELGGHIGVTASEIIRAARVELNGLMNGISRPA